MCSGKGRDRMNISSSRVDGRMLVKEAGVDRHYKNALHGIHSSWLRNYDETRFNVTIS